MGRWASGGRPGLRRPRTQAVEPYGSPRRQSLHFDTRLPRWYLDRVLGGAERTGRSTPPGIEGRLRNQAGRSGVPLQRARLETEGRLRPSGEDDLRPLPHRFLAPDATATAAGVGLRRLQ